MLDPPGRPDHKEDPHACADLPASPPGHPEDEDGFSTAELLGNAALGIGALVVIWGLLEVLGTDVVAWIRGQLGIG